MQYISEFLIFVCNYINMCSFKNIYFAILKCIKNAMLLSVKLIICFPWSDIFWLWVTVMKGALLFEIIYSSPTPTFLSAWIPFIGHLTVSWHFDVLFIVEKHLFASAKFQILFLKNTQKQKTQNFMKIKLFKCLKHPVWDLANHSVMREAFCYRCPYIVEIGHPNRTGGRRLACLNRDLLWDQEKKKEGL